MVSDMGGEVTVQPTLPSKDVIIDQQIENLQIGELEDRQRITALEGKVESLLEIIEAFKTANVVTDNENITLKETTESKCKRLYEEILNVRFMKSKDVMNLLGLKHHTQAYRIMSEVQQHYPNIEIVKSLSKNATVITLKI